MSGGDGDRTAARVAEAIGGRTGVPGRTFGQRLRAHRLQFAAAALAGLSFGLSFQVYTRTRRVQELEGELQRERHARQQTAAVATDVARALSETAPTGEAGEQGRQALRMLERIDDGMQRPAVFDQQRSLSSNPPASVPPPPQLPPAGDGQPKPVRMV